MHKNGIKQKMSHYERWLEQCTAAPENKYLSLRKTQHEELPWPQSVILHLRQIDLPFETLSQQTQKVDLNSFSWKLQVKTVTSVLRGKNLILSSSRIWYLLFVCMCSSQARESAKANGELCKNITTRRSNSAVHATSETGDREIETYRQPENKAEAQDWHWVGSTNIDETDRELGKDKQRLKWVSLAVRTARRETDKTLPVSVSSSTNVWGHNSEVAWRTEPQTQVRRDRQTCRLTPRCRGGGVGLLVGAFSITSNIM